MYAWQILVVMGTEGASAVDFEVSRQVARRVGAEAGPDDRLLG